MHSEFNSQEPNGQESERAPKLNAALAPSDEALGDLLRSLPREQATFGFEERVLRRVRANPSPKMTWGRGLRLAAPLVVAAALGFIVGPSLVERSDSIDQARSQQIAGSGSATVGDQASTELPRRGDRVIPSVASTAVTNGQIVGNSVAGGPAFGQASANSRSNLAQIRSEALRVRRELDQLRSMRDAAGATVTVMMADGVEVQIDVRDLFAVLEQRAAAIAEREKAALGNGAIATGAPSAQSSDGATSDSNPDIEPPLW